jgi:NADPH:quinone reductase-like Zn-dependent oxidoreductase
MKVIAIEGAFGLDHLRPVERPDPEPGPGEVLLRIKAASLNFRDLRMVKGQYNPKQPLPLIPCSDGVGEVTGLGAGVTRVAVGDRVAPIFNQAWIGGPPTRQRVRSTLGGPLDGTLAQQMVLPERGVVKVPPHLSDEEAACLPCAAVTAWSALVTQDGVTAGDTVLVQGSGGVSLFALQIARLLGARVIATSSSDAKLERLREIGAEAGINYRTTPEWGRAARKLAGGEGVDHVVEVGGGKTLEQSLKAVRIGGTISVIGVLSGVAADLNLLPILMQQVRLQGIIVGSRDDFEALNRAIAEHELRPVLDERRFALEQAAEALRHMERGGHFGKIALTVAQ